MMRIHRRVTCCAVLLLGLLSSVSAQTSSPHDMMRQEREVKLVAPEAYLDPFWRECASLDRSDNQIVLHLGDSHLQAGHFTEPIRDFFRYAFGLSGPGLILPYRIAGTNEPCHLRLRKERGGRYRTDLITRRRYSGRGPTGIEAHSTSNRSQELRLTSVDGIPFDRVVVLHGATDRSFSLAGSYGEAVAVSPYSLELAPCATDTLVTSEATTSATLVVPPGATFYGASLESSLPGVVVHTLGYNGATFETYTKGAFASSLSTLSPDLIIISLGTNDAMGRITEETVRSSVRQLVRALRSSDEPVRIVLTTPLMSYSGRGRRSRPNAGVSTVTRAICREAEALGVGYIDTFEAFGGANGVTALVREGVLRSDHIHLTIEGYHALGNAVADALAKDYKRYLTAQSSN